MTKFGRLLGGGLVVLLSVSGSAAGQEAGSSKEAGATEEKFEPQSSVTRNSVRIDGATIEYTATAGWLIMENDDGEPIARFGYTAYTRDGVKDLSRRPVTFAFNGGP
ncbi:MAG: hypothetical protein ACWGON_03450, partial [Gemmatimonadota bacterium]